MITGIFFLGFGIVLAMVGVSTYATCNGSSGATITVTGPGGQTTSSPAGCGALLFVVAFGIFFAVAGLMAALRAGRTTHFRNPWGTVAPPPPIFTATGMPLPGTPSLPKVRCPYCGTLLDPGPAHCPSCGARL